ncbi:2-oxoglutarate dehydrogenase E2 component [Spirochaetota bacterium]|nr:2-oxoglutarate dehydrogenase E2 component [Spirochaetota bacterium]
MSTDIVVPAAGESISEGELATWHKKSGDTVNVDEVIGEIETDKAALEIRAPTAGHLEIIVDVGTSVKVGQKIAVVTAASSKKSPTTTPIQKTTPQPKQAPLNADLSPVPDKKLAPLHPTPSARKLMREHDLSASDIASRTSLANTQGRIHQEHVKSALATKPSPTAPADLLQSPTHADSSPPSPQLQQPTHDIDRSENRIKISRLRATIAQRLVLSQQTGALLTTFNEIDMHQITHLRAKYKESFKKKYDIGLGYMSFFVKATVLALKEFPIINSRMDEKEIIQPHYIDIGVAVATPKGLVVPVLRNADKMSIHDIEMHIKDFALRGKAGKLALEELNGGTFTITNGGVFGSMLSTPIVNYPQSAILGMHNIVKRPVVFNDEIVIHPVMYVAVSYDHRLIDGADAVRFLYRIKEMIEDPSRLLINV